MNDKIKDVLLHDAYVKGMEYAYEIATLHGLKVLDDEIEIENRVQMELCLL